MSTFVFNTAKGQFGYYATLPAANDALIAVPIQTSGLESDATLKAYTSLSALLAASNDEQSTMGRKTCASVTSTLVSGNRVVDFADITWTAATGNACSKLVICYDPDTTTGTDADLIPLFADDFVVTPAGGDVTYQVNASGIADAS